MATRPRTRQAVVRPVYEEFKAKSEWIQDQESDNLLIYLPGFMKENLKVTTVGKNVIRVRGERSVTAIKWHRLVEDYQVPDHCNLKGIRAKFEGGILTLIVPKKTTIMAAKGRKDEAKPTQEQASLAPNHPEQNHPGKSTPNEKDEAKSIQDSSLPPQDEKSEGLRLLDRVENVIEKIAKKTKLDKHGADFVLADKNENIEPKAKEKSKGSTLLDRVENVPEIVEESTLEKHGAEVAPADKNENVEGKDESSCKSENDEKSRVPTLLDRVENVTTKIGDKLKQEKDGIGFALADKNEHVEPKENQTRNAIASASSHLKLEKYKQSLKGLMELDEERQLMVNVGVAMLVIVALGTYVVYRTRK